MTETIRVSRISPERERKLSALFVKYTPDFYWILDNLKKLTDKFPDTYIAVDDCDVKYSDKNLEKLISKIKKDGKNVEDYVIEFISSKEKKYLF